MQYREMIFCRKDVMSVCMAPNREQQRSRFYERSSYSDRCIYFVLKEFRDCLKAQVFTETKGFS